MLFSRLFIQHGSRLAINPTDCTTIASMPSLRYVRAKSAGVYNNDIEDKNKQKRLDATGDVK